MAQKGMHNHEPPDRSELMFEYADDAPGAELVPAVGGPRDGMPIIGIPEEGAWAERPPWWLWWWWWWWW